MYMKLTACLIHGRLPFLRLQSDTNYPFLITYSQLYSQIKKKTLTYPVLYAKCGMRVNQQNKESWTCLTSGTRTTNSVLVLNSSQ